LGIGSMGRCGRLPQCVSLPELTYIDSSVSVPHLIEITLA
jgi:hypothetical protein